MSAVHAKAQQILPFCAPLPLLLLSPFNVFMGFISVDQLSFNGCCSFLYLDVRRAVLFLVTHAW